MKTFTKHVKSAVIVMAAGLLALGCATSTGKSARSYEENYRFVPSIHVEDNPFTGNDMSFWGCSYDQYYAGYWCPK